MTIHPTVQVVWTFLLANIASNIVAGDVANRIIVTILMAIAIYVIAREAKWGVKR